MSANRSMMFEIMLLFGIWLHERRSGVLDVVMSSAQEQERRIEVL